MRSKNGQLPKHGPRAWEPREHRSAPIRKSPRGVPGRRWHGAAHARVVWRAAWPWAAPRPRPHRSINWAKV